MITLKILCFGVLMLHNIIISTPKTSTTELGINQQLNGKPSITNLTEKDELLRKLNETEEHLYQLEWKVIIKQIIENYEVQFDEVELAKLENPIFQLNKTLIKQVHISVDFDRLSERRIQKWLFYLQHPTPYNSFQNLVKRVKASNSTSEEFCRGLSLLYKRLSDDIRLEAMHFSTTGPRSVFHWRYVDLHFVIKLILADGDIPATKSIWRILQELEIRRPYFEN